jgi:ABC-type Zn uptake system ZnuABC Zn-binding protein ZnuA
MRIAALVITSAIPLLLTACGGGDDAGAPAKQDFERPLVVVTTTPLADIVRNVAGDAAEIHQLLQPNSDPHDYEPRPDDIEATAGAKVVFESGNELDHWMEEVVKESGGSPAEVAIAPDHTPYKVEGEHHEGEEESHAEEEDGDEHAESEFDPHWWHDPRNVEAAIGVIRDELAKAAPANAETYRANADAYLSKVKALDAGIAACLEQVPAEERKLVTSHDAFNYFTARYGITVVGAVIPSQSTQAQPSAGEIAELAAVVRREGVKAVFPESSINPELAKTLARETGAKADYVLYGDALGPKGSSGDTYLKMEAANADALVKGFTEDRQGCSISGI